MDKLMLMRPREIVEAVERCMFARLVPLVRSAPGFGKSDIIRQVAAKHNLKVIDFRLTQSDPTDLNGVISHSKVDPERGTYLPLDQIPLEGDQLPLLPGETAYVFDDKGKPTNTYAGWLLFFDELPSAMKAVQAAAYKTLLDKLVGIKAIHRRCVMVAAGNREIDNAIVNTLGTAMQSRLIHMEMELHEEDWLKWAAEFGIDHRIQSWIGWKGLSALSNFQPDHTDVTFACPRTWEFAHRIIHGREYTFLDRKILAGTVGHMASTEFAAYLDCYAELPTIKSILANPKGAHIPRVPGQLWALSGAVGSALASKNHDPIMTYIELMPKEFQCIAMRQAIGRDRDLLDIPRIDNWMDKNGSEIWGVAA